MRLLLVFLAAIILQSLAGRFSIGRGLYPRTLHNNIHARRNASKYTLQDYYKGQSFLDDWDYFTGGDPTGGNVVYLNRDDAVAKNLTYVQPDGVTMLAVDDYSDVPAGGNRNSVRIQTKKSYSGGLFIADFWAMPHGCSVWPAYWSIGPNWPDAGEIDIIEGINNQTTNQYTLHSAPGSNCTLSSGGLSASSSVLSKVCDSSPADNVGCAYSDNNTSSFGHGFNILGGGIFAHLWDSSGVTMWHFTRDQIPADIKAKAPTPSSWPTPVAVWSSATCDVCTFFHDHVLVLDTTICGGWAGAAYPSSGCPGTCAQAIANKTNYSLAKWEINYIAVYQ
ncbi:glycoside hydrolase family 16 protein [Amanita muscaria Koide BX008]|uniref:Glycoside hydrolase family 16 protein n=1 Tax=Amanita muscaria (strain Koide BX008) TaxID=946122 RepID=A0A0C2X4U9_AMAMK|nr:glycoside hydrolase family 16 protein [Amanita muscaria Koide BX008]